MAKRVVVAMSGGVDSSVAAALMVEAGHEAIGVGLRLADRPAQESFHRGCCAPRDLADARAVAAQLDIPFYVMDVRESFKESVIEDFISEYENGRTPVPCVKCNQVVKFDYLAERAMAFGAELLVTGHYARRVEVDGCQSVARSFDREKDQTYFLFGMTQEQLARTAFPLGEFTKEQTRDYARKLGLPTAEKPESQEICFVPKDDYRAFLKAEKPGIDRPGDIVDLAGNVLGRHGGVTNFTVGQRRGLDLGGGPPRYVVELESDSATIVVGEREALAREVFFARDVHWSIPPASASLQVQVRHRGRAAACAVTPRGDGTVEIRPHDPAYLGAVAPGQAAVFYSGDVLYGGGWVA